MVTHIFTYEADAPDVAVTSSHIVVGKLDNHFFVLANEIIKGQHPSHEVRIAISATDEKCTVVANGEESATIHAPQEGQEIAIGFEHYDYLRIESDLTLQQIKDLTL